jgi:hypothetical protein
MTDHGTCVRCLDEPVDPDFTDLGLGRRCADDWSHAAENALHDRLVRALGDDDRGGLPVDGWAAPHCEGYI